MKAATNSLKPYYAFLLVITVVSILALTASYLMRRGPVHDATVVDDLRILQAAIDDYYLSQSRLPGTLRQANIESAGTVSRLNQYEYTKLGARSYQLCATFQTQSRQQATPQFRAAPGGGSVTPDPADHSKGHQCFTYQEAEPFIEPLGSPSTKAR